MMNNMVELIGASAGLLARQNYRFEDSELPITVAKGLGAFAFVILLLVMTIAIIGLVFWLMMLIHAASNDIADKTMWVIILVASLFLGVWPIAAIVYYFVIKQKFNPPKAQPGPKPKSRAKSK